MEGSGRTLLSTHGGLGDGSGGEPVVTHSPEAVRKKAIAKLKTKEILHAAGV
jgi:hypothetical protein